MSRLRAYGCVAYPYDFNPQRKKLDNTALKGVLVGYDDSSASYRVYLPKHRKLIRSGHVSFNEHELYYNISPVDEIISDTVDPKMQFDTPISRSNITIADMVTPTVFTAPHTTPQFDAPSKHNDIDMDAQAVIEMEVPEEAARPVKRILTTMLHFLRMLQRTTLMLLKVRFNSTTSICSRMTHQHHLKILITGLTVTDGMRRQQVRISLLKNKEYF